MTYRLLYHAKRALAQRFAVRQVGRRERDVLEREHKVLEKTLLGRVKLARPRAPPRRMHDCFIVHRVGQLQIPFVQTCVEKRTPIRAELAKGLRAQGGLIYSGSSKISRDVRGVCCVCACA